MVEHPIVTPDKNAMNEFQVDEDETTGLNLPLLPHFQPPTFSDACEDNDVGLGVCIHSMAS